MTATYQPQEITAALISAIARKRPPEKPREIRDKSRGLILRHQPSGYLGLYVDLGRAKRGRLCDARDIVDQSKSITLARVRKQARILRGEDAGGRDFKQERTQARAIPTLADYLDETSEGAYGWWVVQNRKDGAASLARMKSCFLEAFGKTKLDAITPDVVDAWVTRRRRKVKPETINRDLTAIKSALTRAVKWRLISASPLQGFEPLEVDRHKRAERAFTEREVKALRQAMVAREDRLRKARASGNKWRIERGHDPMPGLDAEFVDELRPAVEISLETGMRRGELLALTWDRVDLRRKVIHLEGEKTKSYLSRDVPLNAHAVSVLRKWLLQNGRPTTGRVFTVASLKKSYQRVLDDAKIQRETPRGKAVWHSLRHSFGTRLGASGVDAETIREIMGHADLKTTQRYLHTTEDRKRAAVEQLVES